jgi:phosphate starvation-inducible PhoH-like protein
MDTKKTIIGKFSISLEGIEPVALLGLADENLRFITQHFQSHISVRGDRIRITGPKSEAEKIRELFINLIKAIKNCEEISTFRIKKEIDNLNIPARSAEAQARQARRETVRAQIESEPKNECVYTPKKMILPKSEHQESYIKAIDDYDIVIAIGPAGTGKTYLAVAKAVQALTSGKISRIVLTRPAVEAGESLGFLPGSFKEKVDPYMRPLYDALYDMISVDKIKRLIDEQVVEVAPIAYMRGRTLSDSFIILDEAQNSTTIQMKMFLTRLGWNSKTIVTGDITQIDLDKKNSSGLVDIQDKLNHIDDIKFVYFDARDVVRPPLVSKIINAYEDNNPNAK